MVTWRCSKPGPNIASPLGMGKPLSSSEDQTSRKSLPQMYLRRFEASKRFQGGSCKNMCTPSIIQNKTFFDETYDLGVPPY